MKNKSILMNVFGHTTRPIALLRAEPVEGKHKMSTEEMSAFHKLSIVFPEFMKALCLLLTVVIELTDSHDSSCLAKG